MRIALIDEMGKGKRLSDYERGQIQALHSSGLSHNVIAKRIRRSQTVISNFLRNIENYGKYNNCGKKEITTNRQKRLLIRDIVNKGKSLMESKIANGFTASKQTLWRITQNTEYIKFAKMKAKPKLTDEHKYFRMEWARNHMSFGNKWRQIIFSDEKKFNLDGPDGYKYYWYDLRREPKLCSKRAFGGGSVMVWAAIGWNGRSELAFINGKMNSKRYGEMLKTHLLPFARRITGVEWVFQQDNCKVHTSKHMIEWFGVNGVSLLDWPSVSPDLNIIENMWGELVRRVYGGGRQFSTAQELKTVLIEEWENISQSYIRTLFESLNNRIFEVIRLNGKSIDY